MFDRGYNFIQIEQRKGLSGYVKSTLRYKFSASKNILYIVLVEEYELKIFVVKFFRSLDEKNPKKYNIIYNDTTDTTVIIRTIIDVMLSIIEKEQLASFGFLGAHSIDKKKKNITFTEPKSNTQRYVIYVALALNKFGKDGFKHFTNEMCSGHILLNKHNSPMPTIETIESMFKTMYSDLDL